MRLQTRAPSKCLYRAHPRFDPLPGCGFVVAKKHRLSPRIIDQPNRCLSCMDPFHNGLQSHLRTPHSGETKPLLIPLLDLFSFPLENHFPLCCLLTLPSACNRPFSALEALLLPGEKTASPARDKSFRDTSPGKTTSSWRTTSAWRLPKPVPPRTRPQ